MKKKLFCSPSQPYDNLNYTAKILIAIFTGNKSPFEIKKDMTVTTPWLSSHSHFPNKTQERRDNADTDEDFLREDRGNTVFVYKIPFKCES